MVTSATLYTTLMPLTGNQAEDKNRRPVGIPGGSQYARARDGREERDSKNVDGTTIYRVTLPIPNPQETIEARARAKAKA